MKSLTGNTTLTSLEIELFMNDALSDFGAPTEHVLVVLPDNTRTIPMPLVYRTIRKCLQERVRRLTFLIALGTHPPMTEKQMDKHLGPGWQGPGATVVQHDWQSPSGLARLGIIPSAEMKALSDGLLSETVPVTINRLALEADRILIVNPVFPHEVVGFSGGHKYFFPGIAGSEILNTSHWLGALLTNLAVNGIKRTPVRTLIERAAHLVSTPRKGLAFVMSRHDTVGLYYGAVEEAWSAAADLSSKHNIVWTSHTFRTVLSVAPPMYSELWTAGKCMYKLEPVVSDGGTLIIYAPHLSEISPTHGRWIRQIGYHTRDYFLKQWKHFADVPRAVLAHSTHVKGVGTYENGVEEPRIDVVLATGISRETCNELNLGYQDPTAITLSDYEGLEEQGVLAVPNAGEILYRLGSSSRP